MNEMYQRELEEKNSQTRQDGHFHSNPNHLKSQNDLEKIQDKLQMIKYQVEPEE